MKLLEEKDTNQPNMLWLFHTSTHQYDPLDNVTDRTRTLCFSAENVIQTNNVRIEKEAALTSLSMVININSGD